MADVIDKAGAIQYFLEAVYFFYACFYKAIYALKWCMV
jgi:hypothetical protein